MVHSKSTPHRSIRRSLSKPSAERNGIIKLDVYSVFRSNPSALLYLASALPNFDTDATAALPKRRGRPTHKTSPTFAQFSAQAQILIDDQYDGISRVESDALVWLKLTQTQYIKARNIMIVTNKDVGQVKKRDVAKLCKLEAGKAGKLFDHCHDLNWLD